jgi:hypothetical protein
MHADLVTFWEDNARREQVEQSDLIPIRKRNAGRE